MNKIILINDMEFYFDDNCTVSIDKDIFNLKNNGKMFFTAPLSSILCIIDEDELEKWIKKD